MKNFKFFDDIQSLIGVKYPALQERREARDFEQAMERYRRAAIAPDAKVEAAIAVSLEMHGGKEMSRDEEEQQMVNFVWGNTLEDRVRTRSTVRKSLNIA